MLTDPESHGGSRDDVFEVICPSIPGYGFSEAPHKQGSVHVLFFNPTRQNKFWNFVVLYLLNNRVKLQYL